MTPISVVEDLLANFEPREPREEKLAQALREQLTSREFDAAGQLVGPSLSLASIARHAGLSRNLISHEKCELPGARELLVNVLERLSKHSLQVRCEYLEAEVERLKARLQRQDSIVANRVVLAHKRETAIEPTPPDKYSAKDVLNAAEVIPMHKI